MKTPFTSRLYKLSNIVIIITHKDLMIDIGILPVLSQILCKRLKGVKRGEIVVWVVDAVRRPLFQK